LKALLNSNQPTLPHKPCQRHRVFPVSLSAADAMLLPTAGISVSGVFCSQLVAKTLQASLMALL